jgi:hypothetical protein
MCFTHPSTIKQITPRITEPYPNTKQITPRITEPYPNTKEYQKQKHCLKEMFYTVKAF